MRSMSPIILGLILCLGGCVTGHIEEPKFNLLSKDGDFELRAYESRIVAETIVKGDFSDAPSDGFRRLADYIFGNNTKQTKIAMTAPVAQEKSEKIAMTAPVGQESLTDTNGKGAWRITFTMPSAYTMQDIPTPNNKEVTLRELDPEVFAAVRFSGLNRKSSVEEKTRQLRDWIKAKGHKEKSKEPIYARYNPPWTPWFMRRHEILIAVDPSN
jgi:hypothetical protein